VAILAVVEICLLVCLTLRGWRHIQNLYQGLYGCRLQGATFRCCIACPGSTCNSLSVQFRMHSWPSNLHLITFKCRLLLLQQLSQSLQSYICRYRQVNIILVYNGRISIQKTESIIIHQTPSQHRYYKRGTEQVSRSIPVEFPLQ
jgi:hypothetical protein